jgi:serum/glucocorticoid-regulated kinase 2
VIHVPEEYDYRYISDKRNLIIAIICKGYFMSTNKKYIRFFLKPEPELAAYLTTKALMKKKQSKIPVGNPVRLTMGNWETVLNNQQSIEKMFAVAESSSAGDQKNSATIYSKDKKTISIDSFKCLKVLGKGAYGKVQLVEKLDTKELFAMKSLRKAEIIEQDQVEHTKAERMILAHTNHPFLVGLEYAFQTKDKLFFILQFMRGGELFQHLKRERVFEESRVKFYTACMALGLGHLHSKEIVYRDLKPENVLMDDYGFVMLTDFGMSKFIKNNEQALSFVGTPEYLCPEIINNKGHSFPADWWSLGTLL